jgi:urease accessory protein
MYRAAAAVLILFPALAWAHPGHVAGFLHPFTGLDHLLAMVSVGLWAAQLGGRWRWAVPLAFVGSMALGGALGFAGLHLHFVEPMIAASVLVLGLAVSLRVKMKWPALVLVGAFAVFHGVAHGAEMPPEASKLVYAVGFIAATALLHAIGVLGGALPRARWAGVPVALAGLWLLAI